MGQPGHPHSHPPHPSHHRPYLLLTHPPLTLPRPYRPLPSLPPASRLPSLKQQTFLVFLSFS
ncbi:hypothetical protein E2C01_068248 [Portunus trituberculatus]|uniref:Uncharacterized protein n=1 Tax=Portunus trituberculatus TaxID=210409 RepID=A0A5B7HW07_PORTR|nr:hypothetical protein [Portunus trituberculatus]